MSITPTYPGVYIEELPSFNHSVTAAPTSVTVFIGYTHPFKTKQFNTAVQLFSFADYQANFGGFFSFLPWLPDYVGNAVFQFFQNGGSNAWVVGLRAKTYWTGPAEQGISLTAAEGAPPTPVTLAAGSVNIGLNSVTVTFSAREPTTADMPMAVQLSNVQPSSGDSAGQFADITITYGSQVETYRAVAAHDLAAINAGQSGNSTAAALSNSSLVEVTVADNPPPATASADEPAASGQQPATPAKAPTPAFPLPSSNNTYNVYKLEAATVPQTAPAQTAPAQADAAEAAPGQDGPPPADPTLIDPGGYGQVFDTGASLDVDVPIFNLMVLPGISAVSDQHSAVLSQALAYCERKRAFFIMDAPPNAVTSTVSADPEATLPPGASSAKVAMDTYWRQEPMPVPVSANGAIYFPYLTTVDPLTQDTIVSPPSGFVAGIFAQEDASWGVGKAPAGLETVLTGAFGVVPSGRMTDMQQGVLNNDGVNCLRDFTGVGTVVFGARTLVSDNTAFEQWKYVPVRRTALFIEQSLYGSLGWAVFQPNDTPLWNALTQEVNAFMLSLFRQGNYFQGSTPSEAFLVKCDSTTTTQDDIDQGRVNILVGFAPLKPAEFVVIQISQLAGQSQT